MFIFILAASMLNNLIIPFYLYHQKYGLFKHQYKKDGGCNGFGIIMDGVLAGLMNIVTLYLLTSIKQNVFVSDILIAIIIGIFAMVITHLWMTITKWEVWIMPRPGIWNSGGYWHMFSMTIQIAYLAYPAILIFQNPSLFFLSVTKISIILMIILISLFGLALRLSQSGIKIGKFHLNKEGW